MHPVLIKIGPLTIHTYGVMIAAGFILGLALAVRQARKQLIPAEKIVDLGFYMLLAAIIGSRLFFIIVNAGYYLKHPLDIFKIWEGGLVFYGGVILAIPTAIWFVKKKGLDLWETADIFAPSLAIAHAIGRLGCISAGCCHGREAHDLPWAITFSDPECLAPTGIPLHPTQLYESAGEFLNFLILLILRRRQSFKGQLFWTYLLIYSIVRFTVEFFRGDEARGFLIGNISVSQGISILLFLVAVAGLIILRKKAKQ
ncbi:MAG: prolipoprotein diacylglyceryl transferase [Nitrospirae bacterium]|nr:MAG: prolipoprotein diacylglyceryl transferase [Nitrospirota bacterium]